MPSLAGHHLSRGCYGNNEVMKKAITRGAKKGWLIKEYCDLQIPGVGCYVGFVIWRILNNIYSQYILIFAFLESSSLLNFFHYLKVSSAEV